MHRKNIAQTIELPSKIGGNIISLITARSRNAKSLSEANDIFNISLLNRKEICRFISGTQSLKHSKHQQTAYLVESPGDYAPAYFHHHRLRTGVIRQHIGLLPEQCRLLVDDLDKFFAIYRPLQKIIVKMSDPVASEQAELGNAI